MDTIKTIINEVNALLYIVPEITIAIGIIILVIGGSLQQNDSSKKNHIISFVIMLIASTILCFLLLTESNQDLYIFSKMLHITSSIQGIKLIILVLTMFLTHSVFPFLSHDNIKHFEYYVLILSSILGMMLMISANDLMMLFVSMELQSISLYTLVALRRNNSFTSEAGIKYFILGIFATALFLFGASYLYGLSGSTEFNAIEQFLTNNNDMVFYSLFACSLIIVVIGFKLSIAPFHIGIADIFQGCSIVILPFIVTIPKIAIIIVLANFLYNICSVYSDIWNIIIYIMSSLSMILGAILGLNQNVITRIVAYSTIFHMGFLLMAFLGNSMQFYGNVMEYLLFYTLTIVGFFVALFCVRYNGQFVRNLSDLRGLVHVNRTLALLISLFLLSLIGLPPFVGFIIKLNILNNIIEKNYGIAILSILCSVISAAYYLKIIKEMYFYDKPTDALITVTISVRNKFIIFGCAIIISLYLIGINCF